MTTGGKIGIIVGVGAAVAIVIFMVSKNSAAATAAATVPVTPPSPAPATTQPLFPGAINADDSAAAAQIVALIQASPFASELPYIIDVYTSTFAPGKSEQPSDAYGTLNDGKVTATSGMLKSIWTGWIGAYTTNWQAADWGTTPAAGKTAAQARNAQALAGAAATVWNNFKAMEELKGV